MEWYIGSVNGAITHCLEQKALLIVYIHHPDAEQNSSTSHFNSLWENFDKSYLDQLNYVALKLANDSEGCKQFAAIYPTPIVPACYVIGLGGKPLEIITSVEELSLEKLNKDIRKAAELYEQQFVEYLSKPPSPPKETASGDSAAASSMDQSTDQEAPLDERVILARQKIAEKRKLDEEKKKQEEHEKELRRIKEGKLMQEAKEKTKENEIREAADERRRQKLADQETLRRLREQIRLDKEARAQKAGGVPKEAEEEKKPATEPVINKPVATDECRIQCKFPDGSTLVKQFTSASPLQVVIDAVREDGRVPGEFFLVQTYPRKQLTEYNKSLLDLGLTPASALLVVTGVIGYEPSGIVSTTSGYLSFFIGILYSPFMAIYQFILSFIGMGSGRKNSKQSGKTSNQREDRPSTSDNLRRRRVGNKESRDPIRREGNMSRLRNPDDSDDENATWNGNSTQQL